MKIQCTASKCKWEHIKPGDNRDMLFTVFTLLLANYCPNDLKCWYDNRDMLLILLYSLYFQLTIVPNSQWPTCWSLHPHFIEIRDICTTSCVKHACKYVICYKKKLCETCRKRVRVNSNYVQIEYFYTKFSNIKEGWNILQ